MGGGREGKTDAPRIPKALPIIFKIHPFNFKDYTLAESLINIAFSWLDIYMCPRFRPSFQMAWICPILVGDSSFHKISNHFLQTRSRKYVVSRFV
jgi:hypothetical protein